MSYPGDKVVIRHYLGPSMSVGPALTAKMRKANGQVMHRSSYQSLTPDGVWDPTEIKKREVFYQCVEEKCGGTAMASSFEFDLSIETPTNEAYEDDDDDHIGYVSDDDDVTPERLDTYIGAEVILPMGNENFSGKVKARKRSQDGTLKGTANQNPSLDTRTYGVEFHDGQVAKFGANMIAENMWAQCDLEGNQYRLMDSIVDHKTDGHAMEKSNKYVFVKGGKSLPRSTKGWHLCIKWKDGLSSWERLADVKESYPVEVAE